MHTLIANATLPPAQAVLVMLGFVALAGLLLLVVKLFAIKMSGWKEIAGRFPMRDVSFTGDSYKQQSGVVGSIGSSRRGFFDIRMAQEGVCVSPYFARRNPCLIPWSAVRRVSVSDSSLHVVVNYERPFEFFLPAEALAAFQSRLSPQLFQKALSPFEAAKTALKDSTQPAWMTAIAGSAVKLAEKE
jgi:hypothetical protein